MREAQFKGVEVEPLLQPLSGESFVLKSANKDEEARSDVRVLGFWSKMRQAFFDIKVVSPYARSYFGLSPQALYQKMEKAKIREYRARINEVDKGDFTPLVFTTAGGMAPQSQIVIKKLAHRLAEIKNLPLSLVSGWLSVRFSFALLRSTLVCLRGTRKKRYSPDGSPAIEVAVHESNIDF